MTKSMLPATRPAGVMGRFDPWGEFDDLRSRFDELLSGVFGPFADGRSVLGWTPLADITEKEDAYLVELDVPGVKREDINVEVSGGELTITGEMKEKERAGMPRSRARRMGRFEYRTTLPTHVNADAISADLAEGVLTVRLPKSEAAKPHHIEITNS